MLERFLPRIEFDSYEDFKNNYKVIVPENFNFGFDIVDEWAKENPKNRALVWCNDQGEEKVFTYAEMSRLSNKAANYFKSIGLKKGSVAMLILGRRWEYWICATALIKLGVIFIPGSIQLTKKDLVYRANAADIEMMICMNDDFVLSQVEEALPEAPTVKHIGIVNGSREGWFGLEASIKACSDELERPRGKDAIENTDIMQIYFTSGTTGMPKMVSHNYIHPLGHIVTAKYWQKVEENQLHLSVSDSGWAKFGWGKIYGQWISGATVFAYDMDKFIPHKLLEIIQKYKIRTFCAPPTMYRFMLQEEISKFDLSSVKRWCTAGEPLNPEVFYRWEELTGLKMAEGFGQSEGTVLLANFGWFDPVPGSMGKTSPIYNIKLINSEGKEAEDGEEGEIIVMDLEKEMPVGLFTAYYRDEALTKEALGKGSYNLKDVAWRDSDGYYWFVGRHDDVIKCSGYRIGPFEVESAMLTHPSVVECAITAAPDPVRGQVVKATVVLAKGYLASDDLVKELQTYVKQVTAPYKYPRIIEFVSELPKTLGGKIKRAQIRNQDAIPTEVK